MISYVLNKQSKIILCEDSLTSSIFDLLKYLSFEQFWRILKNSLYFDKLPYFSGDIDNIIFWEKWSPEGTNNQSYIEPDLFVRFKDFDIILEAKRYNQKQQRFQQVNDQIISYYKTYEEDIKTLYYIQVGGLHNRNEEQHEKAIILKTDWTKLLDSVTAEYELMKLVNTMGTNSSRRILKDLIRLFELHQFYKKKWLKDLKINQLIKTNNYYNYRICTNINLKELQVSQSKKWLKQLKINQSINSVNYYNTKLFNHAK